MIENLTDTLDAFFSSRMEQVHTCIPGEIVSYSGHDKRLATVQPLVKIQTNSGQSIELKPIQNVPVVFPSTKRFSMSFDLEKGDGVMLHFSEVGIGNFLNGGNIVEPDDISRFSLTDAIAVPGLWGGGRVPKLGDSEKGFNLVYSKTIFQLQEDSFKIQDGSNNVIESTSDSIILNSNLEVKQ